MNWGIAGPGRMGDRFARALADTPDAELVAVTGRDIGRARTLGDPHGATAYDDDEAFLADERIDVVYIATPNALHAPQALRALRAGKHVLVEKPMALSLADARQLEAEARERGLVLGVGYQLRHHPVHSELVRLLRSGEVGKPLHVQAMWSVASEIPRDIWQMSPDMAGLGSLGGLGVHLIDLLPWIAGDEVTEVVAMDDGSWDEHPVEFFTTASLRFAGGCFGQLMCSRRIPHAANSVVVHASECRLEARGTLSMEASGSLVLVRDGQEEVRHVPLGNVYRTEIEAFTEHALHGGAPFHASALDGVRSVALTNAIVQAAQTGRAVQPEPQESTADGRTD